MLERIQKAASEGSYLITAHLFSRLLRRGIDLNDVVAALLSETAECIEDYPDFYLGPCCLVLCRGGTGSWYHVVCSYSSDVALITVYVPVPARWSDDLKRRI